MTCRAKGTPRSMMQFKFYAWTDFKMVFAQMLGISRRLVT